KHEAGECPVCGTPGATSGAWQERTAREVAALRKEAQAFDAAQASRTARIREARQHITSPPSCLAQAAALGLPSLAEARRVWAEWSQGGSRTSAAELADHLESWAGKLDEAVD